MLGAACEIAEALVLELRLVVLYVLDAFQQSS
jgi:hypothetical protein